MNPQLRALLKEGNLKDEHNYTHETIFPKEKWNIRSSFLTEFWKRYCDLVQAGKNDLFLLERPHNRAPFTVFLKFEFQNNGNVDIDTPFSDKFILHLCSAFQYVVYDQMKIPTEMRSKTLRTCYLEEPPIIDGEVVTCQIRIQFPYCKCDTSIQTKKLIPELIKRLRSENVVAYLDQQPIKDWNEIIDSKSVINPVPLIGSTSHSKNRPFYLKYILDIITETQLEDEHIPDMDVGEAFDLKDHDDIARSIINPAEFENMDINSLVPLFLSLNYCTYVVLPKDVALTTIKLNIVDENSKELEKAHLFLDMLGQNRKNNAVYWSEIGQALYRCSRGSTRGLEIWRQWTQDSTVKTVADCNKVYISFRTSKVTIKTIAWYAKLDDPRAYKKWHEKECERIMRKAIDCTHEEVAECMYEIFWLEVAFDEYWHIYDAKAHRWFKDPQGTKIHKLVKDKFVPEFEAMRAKYSIQVQEERDEEKKEQYEIAIKKISALITKLKMLPFKKQCIKMAESHFAIDGFSNNLDENPHYLGMTNCIIDTSAKGRPLVRDGKPEDFVSMCTNIEYPYEYDEQVTPQNFDEQMDEKRPYDNVSDDLDKLTLRGWHSPLTRKLMIWIGRVFVDNDLRHYFWKDASSFLRGRNAEKLLRIWSGPKDASKSMIVKLFQNAFGMYSINMPVSFLSGKTGNSSAPSPELARVKGTHIAIMAEPDETEDKLSSGKVKKSTGNDSQYARFLHSNGGDITCMQKMVLMTNNIPEIIGLASDDAGIGRLLILPFLSLWVKDHSENIEEQYKLRRFELNPFFEDEIPNMASSFVWVLVQYFDTYMKEGLKPPEKVVEYTNDYIKKCDPYHLFKEENLEYAYKDKEKTIIDTNVKLLHRDLYAAYKSWYVDTHPGQKKIPDSNLVKREFEKRLGKQVAKVYVGIRLIQAVPTL